MVKMACDRELETRCVDGEHMLPAVHSPGMMRGRLARAARSAANVQYTMDILQCAQLQSGQF